MIFTVFRFIHAFYKIIYKKIVVVYGGKTLYIVVEKKLQIFLKNSVDKWVYVC